MTMSAASALLDPRTFIKAGDAHHPIRINAVLVGPLPLAMHVQPIRFEATWTIAIHVAVEQALVECDRVPGRLAMASSGQRACAFDVALHRRRTGRSGGR
jgi:hypothetical protein